MRSFICLACGTAYPTGAEPPASCAICEDERQFVRWEGQAWTDDEELARGHGLRWRDEHGVPSLDVQPDFAIGQRALLVPDGAGHLLWDCVALVRPGIVERIRNLGGLTGIAISHPHYYSSMGEWSSAFAGVPIYLHEADRTWVQNPHPSIVHWSGDCLPLSSDLTLIRCGGHFDGAQVLHWRSGAEGRGVLLVGDVAQVTRDRRHLSFMRSYPNYIPLDATAVRRIAEALAPFAFDRVYGAFPGLTIAEGGRAALDRSVERYLAAIGASP
jgi:hypothetical protein